LWLMAGASLPQPEPSSSPPLDAYQSRTIVPKELAIVVEERGVGIGIRSQH
jgi:hypothetical protein